MTKFVTILVAAATAIAAVPASAAIITFDASNNGESPLGAAYQPLLAGYAGDGAALGITINWGGTWTSNRANNFGVTDHTPGSGGLGYVAYDGGAPTRTITFDQAVTLPSFYFANFFSGNFAIEFRGYTNVGDATPIVSIVRNYSQPSSYTWIQETGLAGYQITAFSFSGANFKQLDDITVLTGAVPEPASWAMLIAGFGLVGSAARRRRGPVAVAA